MAHYFSYDILKHKHTIHTYRVRNELGESLGYRAEVTRVDAKKGGFVEDVTLKKIKHKVFTTDKKARDYAIECMINLDYRQEIKINN